MCVFVHTHSHSWDREVSICEWNQERRCETSLFRLTVQDPASVSGLQLKIISVMINHESYQQVNRLITHYQFKYCESAHHNFTGCEVNTNISHVHILYVYLDDSVRSKLVINYIWLFIALHINVNKAALLNELWISVISFNRWRSSDPWSLQDEDEPLLVSERTMIEGKFRDLSE